MSYAPIPQQGPPSYQPHTYGSVPPQSYGSVPPQSYGQAQQAAASVMGVPLEPGERVVFFKKHDYTVQIVFLVILGLLTLIFLVSIAFLIWALVYSGSRPRAHAITNRRVIVWMKSGPPQIHPLGWIADLTPEREKHQSSGGLLGAAVAGIQNMTMEAQARNAGKIAPAYWTRTNAIQVTFSNGQRVRIPADKAYGPQMGQLLARAVFNREADHLPPATHPA
jgi:hypothetical protein